MKYIYFFITFIKFLGMQNDYLFPKANDNNWYPFSKPHLWKTRIGFSTAWAISKAVHGL